MQPQALFVLITIQHPKTPCYFISEDEVRLIDAFFNVKSDLNASFAGKQAGNIGKFNILKNLI